MTLDKIIKEFLNEGTKKGFGDLSMMVGSVTKAHQAGRESGIKEIESLGFIFGEREGEAFKQVTIEEILTKLKENST